MQPMPFLAPKASQQFQDTAWTETSRAAVGSSRTSRRGGCRWRGRCRRGPSGRRKAGAGSARAGRRGGRCAAASMTRARRAAPRRPDRRRSGWAMASAAVKRGLRLSSGSWNTIWIAARSGSSGETARRERCRQARRAKTMRPAIGSSRRVSSRDKVLLPQPDSPDQMRRGCSPRRDLGRRRRRPGGGRRRREVLIAGHADSSSSGPVPGGGPAAPPARRRSAGERRAARGESRSDGCGRSRRVGEAAIRRAYRGGCGARAARRCRPPRRRCPACITAMRPHARRPGRGRG